MGQVYFKYILIILDDEVNNTNRSILTKCFCCGDNYKKKDLVHHLISAHDEILPSKEKTRTSFNMSTFKCRYCNYSQKDETLRRYHLFQFHKDKLQKLSSPPPTAPTPSKGNGI